jgi:hypothetical protein
MHKPALLPYTEAKPIGAADFYFAINATFRFILGKRGMEALRRYWTELGQQYFAPVARIWKKDGLMGVQSYWKAFFAAEPGAEAGITRAEDTVVLDVKVCPAIKQLREHRREIVPCFCQHCYFISEAIAAPAGLTVRVEGGNGSCRQTFLPRNTNPAPQDLSKIREASC